MTVRVLPSAYRDLDEIDSWVFEQFGSSFASKTQTKLLSTFELLAEFPEMGRRRPDVDKRPVRFFLLKPYWIVYEPGTPLVIRRVYHSARDLRRLKRP
jgi:plasmid stabilization system protein ParE